MKGMGAQAQGRGTRCGCPLGWRGRWDLESDILCVVAYWEIDIDNWQGLQYSVRGNDDLLNCDKNYNKGNI